ncbi:MAG: beta galactosidase jelly roll domain-containing protein [Bacteroidota bacterium]
MLNRFFIALLFFSTGTQLFAQLDNYRRVLSLRGDWKFNIGNSMSWADPDYDDSNWEYIRVPSAWEDEGFNGYDGYAWYRTEFNSSDLDVDQNLYLNLGYIDDVDEVYLNGELIGFSGSFPPDFNTAYNALRLYPIPESVLKKGRNVISVKIYDVVHGGGIINGRIGLYTTNYSPDDLFVLEGVWKFREGDEEEWSEKYYDDSGWSSQVLPSFCKVKKESYWFWKSDYESIFWYRKTIKVPENLRGKDLTLLLGKIDDFDQTFINGKFVGTTDDGKRLGRSGSWQTYRIYPLDRLNLNDRDDWTIAIRVFDIGGDAGVYEGPLALIESSKVARFIRNLD